MNNPKIRAALEAELATVEQARSRYAEAANQAYQLSHAAIHAQFPELRGVTAETLPQVMNVLQRENPARHAAVMQAITSTDALHRASVEANAQQKQIEQARIKTWSDGEDRRFAETVLAKENPETVKEVTFNAKRILKESYGIDPQEFQQMIQTTPAFRSVQAQSMIFDLIKTKLNQEKISAKRAPANVPPVQRPGVSKPPSAQDDEAVAEKLRAFRANPTPRTGADYLKARSDAKRRD